MKGEKKNAKNCNRNLYFDIPKEQHIKEYCNDVEG